MKFILYIFFFIFSLGILAQKNVRYDSIPRIKREFNQQELQNYIERSDFDYTEFSDEPNVLERAWNWIKRMMKKFLSWIFQDPEPAIGVFRFILNIIPYVALLIILYLIIKVFLNVNTKNIINGETNSSSITYSDEEELINSENLQELLSKAIEEGNYRVAVRYYYLFVLKKLADKKLILWQQEKTNEDYIKELKETQLGSDFKNTTLLYDFVWYGNFDLNQSEFGKAQSQFKELFKKIDG